MCAYGFYLVGQGNLERRCVLSIPSPPCSCVLIRLANRELQREKAWSRIHLVPLMLAEQDRDAYRRNVAAVAREREIMKDVPGWEVSGFPTSRATSRVSKCSDRGEEYGCSRSGKARRRITSETRSDELGIPGEGAGVWVFTSYDAVSGRIRRCTRKRDHTLQSMCFSDEKRSRNHVVSHLAEFVGGHMGG